jgi:hypothetical protein
MKHIYNVIIIIILLCFALKYGKPDLIRGFAQWSAEYKF